MRGACVQVHYTTPKPLCQYPPPDFVMPHKEIGVLYKRQPRVYAPPPSAVIRDRKKAVRALTISSVSRAPAVS